jgi:internalin A
MKIMNWVLLAFLITLFFIFPGCDYVTGKLSETVSISSLPFMPFTIEINGKTDWKLKVTDTNLDSLVIIIGMVPNDRVSKVDISALTGLKKLTYLKIQSRSIIEDLSPIALLPNLTTLELSVDRAWRYDPPLDISPLASLRNLTSLTITSDDIKSLNISMSLKLVSLSIVVEKGPCTFDLGLLENCTDLKELKLKCGIKGIDTFSSLSHLQSLDLSDNGINDISYLSKCKKITELNLGNNSLSDITPLSSLVNLDTLELINNKLADISPLSLLTKLSSLDLRNNQIQEVSCLASLTNLKTLKLSNNLIEDVSALASLKNMASIWLGANKIKNVTALKEMPNLHEIMADGNPIDDESVNELLKLQQDGTTVYYYAIEECYKLIPLLFTDEENDGRYYLVNPIMELETQSISATGDWSDSIQYLDQQFKAQGLDVSLLLEALIERNQAPVNLDILSAKEDGYVIDYDGIFESYFINGPMDGWKKIREDLPDFRCYVSISIPVYDKERSIFLVYLGWMAGGLTGSGDIYAFSYDKGKLINIASAQLWIS